jgi:hypothetical protein
VQQRRDEVAQIGEGLESDEVSTEQTGEDLPAPWQDAIHLGRGKRDMQKEPDASIWQPCAQQSGHKHQVIVVHPHHVAGPVFQCHGISEGLIDLAVSLSSGRIDRNAVDQVVE